MVEFASIGHSQSLFQIAAHGRLDQLTPSAWLRSGSRWQVGQWTAMRPGMLIGLTIEASLHPEILTVDLRTLSEN